MERRCRFTNGRNEEVMNNLTPFYRDFWNNDIEVYYEYNPEDRSHDNKISELRLAYLELSKLIYLPFIYGYDFNCITQCTYERDRIIWDLNKVRFGYFKTPNDIRRVLKAMIHLSDHISDPLISDSKYLQLQADEYVKLFDATTDEEIEARHNVLVSLQSFKQKKNQVNRDPDLNAYLRVFMNTVTSSYRIAELIGNYTSLSITNEFLNLIHIDSGQFQLATRGDSVIINSAIDLLSLVPTVGPTLKSFATQINEEAKSRVQDQINEATKRTVQSFYHREIEQSVELVCVNMLAGSTELIKNRIQALKSAQRSESIDTLSDWVASRLEEVQDDIRTDFASYRPHDFLSISIVFINM